MHGEDTQKSSDDTVLMAALRDAFSQRHGFGRRGFGACQHARIVSTSAFHCAGLHLTALSVSEAATDGIRTLVHGAFASRCAFGFAAINNMGSGKHRGGIGALALDALSCFHGQRRGGLPGASKKARVITAWTAYCASLNRGALGIVQTLVDLA